MDDVRPVQAASEEAGIAGPPAEDPGQKVFEADFPQKVDFQVLHHALNETELERACLVAREHALATVLVKPSDVDSARRLMGLGVVQVASTAGHPFGGSTSAVKVYEARDILRRGVREIYAYPNPGKLRSRAFQHQEIELLQIAEACREVDARWKLVVDDLLLDEEMRIVSIRMAKRLGASHVVALRPRGLDFFAKYCGFRVELEVAGVQTLDEAIDAFRHGATRILTAAPEPLLSAHEQAIRAKQPVTEPHP